MPTWRSWRGLPQLESINLAYTKITDLGLEHLAPLENVKVLDLYYAEYVTDLGIAHLKHWKNLEYLNVRGTKVTSSLFEHVSKMTKLRFLDVGHSRVNDDLFEAPRQSRSSRASRVRRQQDERCCPASSEVVARAAGVERFRPAANRLRSLERRGDRLQHRPDRAARSTGSPRPGGDQRHRSGHRGAGALEESAHAGPQGNPRDQQGDRGPDRPAEAAASQALEGQGHRRRGRPVLPADGRTGSPRVAGDEHHRRRGWRSSPGRRA